MLSAVENSVGCKTLSGAISVSVGHAADIGVLQPVLPASSALDFMSRSLAHSRCTRGSKMSVDLASIQGLLAPRRGAVYSQAIVLPRNLSALAMHQRYSLDRLT